MSEEAATVERASEIGESPESRARRWKLELKLAGKREYAWRRKAKLINEAYTPENPAANTFNVLWTNTETLRQACYNSLPQPLVRRRYHDEDPVGRQVSRVLQRCLDYCQDAYDFDGVIKGDVLCMLLPGRAVSRVRYVPTLKQVGADNAPGALAHSEGSEDAAHEPQEGAYEELEWEQCVVERVQWDDFRIGPGTCWEEVEWVAFRHQMTRDTLVEKFGEQVGRAVAMQGVADEEVEREQQDSELFKRAEVWEVWSKDNRSVLWVSNGFPSLMLEEPDPLSLRDFFPVPRPLYAIEKHDSLVPTPLYSQYEQQAKELNRISARINKLVEGLRVRGIYDATLGELAELMKAGDNELVPAQNVTALLERGGLEKAIWVIPIDLAAAVLKELYAQREATKAVIYEITGIADIMRAASDPQETFGAQRIKTTWGTQRLQRMQSEVQRYIRDLLRLKAEVIAERFQPETILGMSLVQLPSEQALQQQYAQAQAQYMAAAQQAQAAGDQPPPPPEPPQEVTIEAVVAALRDEMGRGYRIDIETDSTLTATQDNDAAALNELLTGITGLVQGLGPAVQAGAIPVEAVKEIILVACRRAKLGSAVEDALEKVAPPAPQPDPAEAARAAEETKAQAQMQLEQFKAQMETQRHERELAAKAESDRIKAELDAEVERAKQAAQAQDSQHQAELDAERDRMKAELESLADQRREAFERWKAELDSSTRIVIAELAAGARAKAAQSGGEEEPGEAGEDELAERPTSAMVSGGLGGMVSDVVRAANADVIEKLSADIQSSNAAMLETLQSLVQQLARPKRIVRGPDGRAMGVE